MYHPTSNKLIVNSDALKEPSFSRYFPNSLNYGYIGFTIAREILRAFDNDNRNKSNVTQFSIEHFKEKSDCFTKQYRLQKENMTDKYIDDLTTLAENIVDNGGLKIAHRAYKKYLQSISEDQINKDAHAPGEIRTIITLSNYKPFSNAFKCKLNTTMNPVDKCEVWKNQKQN
uniref:Peptidase_M13 domain-containing protein n=1 Tax=Strongyloides papillosus TaxID=174720 RepID=A0A0N5C6G1_STREA